MPRKKKVNLDDVTTGPLKKRRYGLRIDDEVEVFIVAGDVLRVVKGRVLTYKDGLQLIDSDGYYHKVSFDWITDFKVLKHNRPHPSEDPEYEKRVKKQKQEPKPNVDNAYR